MPLFVDATPTVPSFRHAHWCSSHKRGCTNVRLAGKSGENEATVAYSSGFYTNSST